MPPYAEQRQGIAEAPSAVRDGGQLVLRIVAAEIPAQIEGESSSN